VYVTVRDLKVWNVQLIAGAACEKHRTDGSDLFDDWQKYCKHLGGQQQAFALLGTWSVRLSNQDSDSI
jgi:hypothetical protein